MPRGRRCDLGCESWPDEKAYEVCPACGEPTKVFRNLNVLDEDDALKLKRHLDFEDYYERRCIARGIPTDGPIPGMQGRIPEVAA